MNSVLVLVKLMQLTTTVQLTNKKFTAALFWQIKLDHESSLRTTFATPFGRYRFLRMPFGINSASEVFQRAMEQIFTGFPCSIIVDDIIVGGKGEKEHDENLRKVLNRAQQVNLKTKPTKKQIQAKRSHLCGTSVHRTWIKTRPSQDTGHYRDASANSWAWPTTWVNSSQISVNPRHHFGSCSTGT